MKRTIKQPRFGGGIVCDNAKTQPSGKIDANGIFTKFWAWGYPANRNWFLIITLFYVPKKQTPLIFGIRKKGSSKIDTIKTLDIKNDNLDNAHIINLQIGYVFESEGDYELICTLKDYKTKLIVPFNIRTREWPSFSNNEIKILEKNKAHLPFKVSAQLKCKNCEQHYAFEEKILPNESYSVGTVPFPEDGIFECESCGNIMKLKDIQGQIRTSIKDTLINFLNPSKDV